MSKKQHMCNQNTLTTEKGHMTEKTTYYLTTLVSGGTPSVKTVSDQNIELFNDDTILFDTFFL